MFRCTGITLLALVVPSVGQIVSYEATSFFPEEVGWIRSKRLYPPERWLEDGFFYMECEVVDPRVCEGEDDFYRWNLTAWAGVPHLFAEWELDTDGPRSEIPEVAPASFVAAGTRGIVFHSTIARDQVRFFIDLHVPVWIDIEPDTAHRFRLDIFSKFWYEFSIDGKAHVAGVPEGAYPTADSFIKWGARAACHDSTTAYDYVRFGVPEEEPVDCDAIRRFKARCRNGRIKAKVKSSLEETTELTITNDGDHRTMRIKPSGKGKVKYKKQSGEHTILLLDCPHVSQVVDCVG